MVPWFWLLMAIMVALVVAREIAISVFFFAPPSFGSNPLILGSLLMCMLFWIVWKHDQGIDPGNVRKPHHQFTEIPGFGTVPLNKVTIWPCLF